MDIFRNPDYLSYILRCPQTAAITTANILRERAGLSNVHVIPAELLGRREWERSSDQFSIDLGSAGASFVEREFNNAIALGDSQTDGNIKLGVSGGRSVFGLLNSLPYQENIELNIRIEPLVIGPVPYSMYSATSIAELAAQKFVNAKVNYSANVEIADGKFIMQKISFNLPEELNEFDWLILGVGSSKSGSFKQHLENIPHSDAVKKAAIGDICSRLFDENGKDLDQSMRDMFVQLRLTDLPSLAKVGRPKGRRVMLVAGGKTKVGALAVVLQREVRWVNSLITDELTARCLIRELERPRNATKEYRLED